MNWTEADGTYVSGQDPQILLENVNGYVNTVDIYADYPGSNKSITLFYKSAGDTDFSEERKYDAQNLLRGITLKQQVSLLRIDLLEQEGITASIDKVVLNARDIGLDFWEVLLWAEFC